MTRSRENYCKHGTYVGGCGADYMCGWCESGVEPQEDETTALPYNDTDWPFNQPFAPRPEFVEDVEGDDWPDYNDDTCYEYDDDPANFEGEEP
jgi:hypothetical protein